MAGFFSDAEVAAISGGRRPPPPKSYRLPDQFPSLSKAAGIVFDLESVDKSIGEKRGPGWRRDAFVVGFAVSLYNKKYEIEFAEYYPLRHKGVQNLDENRVWDWITTELAFFTGEIAGANLLYDFDGVQYKDVYAPLARFRDVQWAEALLDEYAFSYQLKTLAKKWLGLSKATDELEMMYGPGYITRFNEVHPGHARTYGLGDVTLPVQVLEKQKKQLKKENLDELYDLECRLLPFLLYMRRLGVRVDLNQAANMETLLVKRRDDAIKRVATTSGVDLTYDNYGSPVLMKRVFDNLGIQYPYLTGTGDNQKLFTPGAPGYDDAKKDGKPSFRKLWLEEGCTHDISDDILEANIAEKARGTFVEGYIGDCAIGDRVHCEFHPLRKKKEEHEKSQGTITGRFSGSNPNLQNIPTRDEFIGPLCRSMFVADEGAQWWSQDYSQIEYRFLVHYAIVNKCQGFEVPQALYLKDPNTDFHDMCSRLMYSQKGPAGSQGWNELEALYKSGFLTEEVFKKKLKQLRKPAKNLNFGMVYGMGEAKLANQLGMTNPDGTPTAEALMIMKTYHEAAPYIRALNKLCVSDAEKHEFITTILSRRGRFNMWEPRYTPKGAPKEPALPYEEALAKWGNKIHVTGTHKALNKKLQGSAADMMKLAMVLLWESGVFDVGNDITCVLTVHDELNGSFVPSERGEKSRLEVKRIMENAMKLEIPVMTSGDVGKNWADAK